MPPELPIGAAVSRMMLSRCLLAWFTGVCAAAKMKKKYARVRGAGREWGSGAGAPSLREKETHTHTRGRAPVVVRKRDVCNDACYSSGLLTEARTLAGKVGCCTVGCCHVAAGREAGKGDDMRRG